MLQASGLARTTLADLFDRNGKPDPSIRRLLREMQARSNPVKPRRPRRDRSRAFPQRGSSGPAETPRRSSTSCVRRLDDGVPTVIEVAFAYAPARRGGGQLFTGVNWSPGDHQPVPAARQPAARAWSACSPGSIAESDDPVLIAVHLASPVIQYLDRGKSGIALRGGEDADVRWSRRERRLTTSRRWTPPRMARSPTTSSLRSRA